MIRASAMLILFSFICQAQAASNKVPVSFRVDGKKEAVSYKVKFTLDGKVIEPSYFKGGFIMPQIFTSQELDDKKEVGIKVVLGDKEIDFSPDTASRFKVQTLRYSKEWLIIIDKRPFEEMYTGVLGEALKEHGDIIYELEISSTINGAGFNSIIVK